MRRVSVSIIAAELLSLFLLLPFSIKYSSGESENLPKCIAFRLDDIQDYFLNEVQLAIMGVFQEKNASLTAGVIGKHFGEDPKLVSFIADVLHDNRLLIFMEDVLQKNISASSIDYKARLEIANHGWEHEDFTELSKENQSSLIRQTNEKISRILEVYPIVFIPPYNSINNETVDSLSENGIIYFSANTTAPLPAYPTETIANAKFNTSSGDAPFISYHFPSGPNTGDVSVSGQEWTGKKHQEVLSEIEMSLKKYGFAVVTMHPQEFSLREGFIFNNSVNQQQIQELKLLIDKAREEGFNIVPLGKIKTCMSE